LSTHGSNPSRREFLRSAPAAALAAHTLESAAKGQNGRKPNIILIVLDDLGYGEFGCYGQQKIQTPNIDRFATQGIRYTDFYAGGAVCAPSRSVLMTGLHAGHTSVRANAGTIPLRADPEDRTVAQLLHDNGYSTGLFGKWGLGDFGSSGTPDKKGFDEYYGFLHQVHPHNYYTDFLWRSGKKEILGGNLNGKKSQYSADLIADASLQFLKQQKKDKPYFLYVPTTLPHAVHEVPDTQPYSRRDWPEIEKIYAAMITRADRHVGALLDALKHSGQEENTVVFITSDNGAQAGEHHSLEFFRSNGPLRGQKTQVYEGGIRVPMIVRWPGKIQPGTVSDLPWTFCDFLPTAADIAGVRAPRNLDGQSMTAAFQSGAAAKDSPPRFLYWEFYRFDAAQSKLRKDSLAQAARWGDWKAVRSKPGAPLELYNLRTDISESTNVAAANPKVAAKLESFIASAHTEPRPHNTGSMQFVR
jgi:arylsulfatase A-like enzyme